MMKGEKYLAAVAFFLATLLSSPSRAMETADFDAMTTKNQANYIFFMFQGVIDFLQTQNRPDDAKKASDLLNNLTKDSDFFVNLTGARQLNESNVKGPDNLIEMEQVFAATFGKKGVDVPMDNLETLSGKFTPTTADSRAGAPPKLAHPPRPDPDWLINREADYQQSFHKLSADLDQGDTEDDALIAKLESKLSSVEQQIRDQDDQALKLSNSHIIYIDKDGKIRYQNGVLLSGSDLKEAQGLVANHAGSRTCYEDHDKLVSWSWQIKYAEIGLYLDSLQGAATRNKLYSP